MANFKPELKDKRSVIAYYDLCNNPKYQIFVGTTTNRENLVINWLDDDNGESGKEQLMMWLNMIEETPSNTNVYTFQSVQNVIEKTKNGNTYKECTGLTQRFQLHEATFSIAPKETNESLIPTNSVYIEKMLFLMEKQNSELKERLLLLESQNDDDDDDDVFDNDDVVVEKEKSPQDRILGALAGIIERPQFIDMVEMGIMGFLSNFNKKE